MNIRFIMNVLGRLRQVRRQAEWSRERLERHQADALRRLRAHAYAHSSFYQRFHAGLFDRPLEELPVLTKAAMMDAFDDLMTDPAIRLADVRVHLAAESAGAPYLGRYRVNATSGSSGNPGIFLFDEDEWLTVMASFARAQEWAGAGVKLYRRRRMATVASLSPWHMSAQVGASAQTLWTPSIRIAASEPLAQIVERLNGWQPHVLITYASMARILAEEQLAGRLAIRPETVFASSEVLTDETRRRVKLAWGSEPFNQYASTETAEIAAECRECRRMHLFEDLVLVEVVDEQHRPVPPGEYGARLLVTTLFSRTQPLIRYALNDSVRLGPSVAQACPCGRPFGVLEGVQGRVEDLLRLPGLRGEPVTIQPLVFNRVMDILPISGWQVAQEADGSLTVLVSGTRAGFDSAALVQELGRALAEQGAQPPSIRVQQVAAIAKSASGKAPLIKAWRDAPVVR